MPEASGPGPTSGGTAFAPHSPARAPIPASARSRSGGPCVAPARPTPGQSRCPLRDLIMFGHTMPCRDELMIKARLDGNMLPIPTNIIQKAGLKDGDEVEVRLEDGNVVITPIIANVRFKKELRGCVESSKIDPLEVKKIWNA